VTPEKIVKNKQLMNVLERMYKQGNLARIVIDEAHCCSEWGHDFRPDYKRLGMLKQSFPQCPIIALTATCASSLLPGLCRILSLKLDRTLVFRGSLNRPNLKFSVVAKPASNKLTIEFIARWIETNYPNECGIIYCLSRKDTELVAKALNEVSPLLKCAVYHADIETAAKESVHHQWRLGTLKIVCATIAFGIHLLPLTRPCFLTFAIQTLTSHTFLSFLGMGINHLNVRFVIHHSPSKALESYYQEAGRAGRDGQPAECVILYRAIDVGRLSAMLYGDNSNMDKVVDMIKYCNTVSECRRKMLLEYFYSSEAAGEDQDVRCDKGCDVCATTTQPQVESVTKLSYTIGRVMKELSGSVKWTITKLIAALKCRLGQFESDVKMELESLKAESSELFEYPVGKHYSDFDLERLVIHLMLRKYLKQVYQHTAYNVQEYWALDSKFIKWMQRCELENKLIDPNGDFMFAFQASADSTGKAVGKGKRRNISFKGKGPAIEVIDDDHDDPIENTFEVADEGKDLSDEVQIIGSTHINADPCEVEEDNEGDDVICYKNKKKKISNSDDDFEDGPWVTSI
jgi:ATP-dependent DNA helicase Q1